MPLDRTYKKRESQFDSCIKVRKRQLEWLRKNKDTKTMAGYLDKIINQYKKYEKH